MPQGSGRGRHADGFYPRRRAADALRDRQDCRRADRAEEVHLPLHERPAAQGKTASLQAQQVPHVFRSRGDRKSTRLNSSHQIISYAVFCLKKKTTQKINKTNTSTSTMLA